LKQESVAGSSSNEQRTMKTLIDKAINCKHYLQ